MAWTIDDYNILKAAIAQGARRVEYGDKRVEYMSLNEMLKAKSLMEKEIFPKKRPTRKFASFTKGLE